MRNTRRSLLEVHGISQAALQRHPHPDAECNTHLTKSREQGIDYNKEWRNSELLGKPENISDVRPRSKSSPINFEELPFDRNFSKRTPSLQTVYSFQTESSCSWSEENDKESTVRVQKKLQENEDLLYDDHDHVKNTDTLKTEENILWKKKFPYLRVVGKNILPEVCSTEYEIEAALIENTEEEIIEQDGVYEESDSTSPSGINANNNHAFPEQDILEIKEKVLQKLTDHLATKVIEWIAALAESRRKSSVSRIHSSVMRLPPVTTGHSSPSRQSPMSRPFTGLNSKRRILVPQPGEPLNSETYLQGLLTVSSKVLQSRIQDKATDEWYKEILPTPENSVSCTPRKFSASSNNSHTANKKKQDTVLRAKDVKLQNLEESKNTISLPSIHQKPSPIQSQQFARIGTEAMHQSRQFLGQRLLTASKNLPFLKHDSSDSQKTSPSKRISSALPNKPKARLSEKQSVQVTRSYIADQLKDFRLHVPFSVQHRNTNVEQHIVLSPFTLLPIVKSITPLTSISRPKSKLDRRKASTPQIPH